MQLNILHFSDLHYVHDDSKIINLRDKIIDNAKEEDKIDLIIFSGDLLQKPSSRGFNDSYEYFIKPIIEKYDTSIDNCFFTIGNHDIDLNKRSKIIYSGLKMERTDKKTIQEIINGEINLREFEDYQNFINGLNQKTLYENNTLYKIYKTKVNKIDIGCVSINTSLFMEGSKVDFGNLWINPDLLIESVKKINNMHIKILNLHHPLDWFSNKTEIEKIILDKFNLVLFGHEHNHDGKHITDLYNKDILSLYATSLYHPKNERNGFCIYTYNIDNNELMFKRKDFNKQQNIFETIVSDKIENVNLMKKASKAIRNQHICSEIYPNFKNHINKYLAINLTSDNNKKDIEEIYVHPKIIEEISKEDNNRLEIEKKEDNEKIISLDNIIEYNSNIVLQGKKESGKTTLLNMINITCLLKYNDHIPIYVSGDELFSQNSISIFTAKIEDYVNKFYHNKNLDIKKMVKEKRFIFLIDNINNLSSNLLEEIMKLDNTIISTLTIKEHEFNDEKILFVNKECHLFQDFKKLEIKALRKRDNKTLTKCIVPEDSYKRISNKVVDSIANLNLPSNPFITTLLAWMYVEKIDIRENEPQIIDVFLDYLLEKADLSKTFKGKLDFKDKKDLLSKIAYKFFSEQKLSIKEDDILEVIINHSKDFYAFDINSKDILDYFYKRRILINNNNSVQFSYRVFYYYFISSYMISNKDFYNTVVDNKLFIINMIDELKYYSALQRDDTNIIGKIENYFLSNTFNSKIQKLVFIKNKTNNVLELKNNKKEVIKLEEIIEDSVEEDEKNITKQEKELKHKIDDIKTEIRENKVEIFNKDTCITLQDSKSSKEEFFILNMIYSEFVKHLVGVKIEEKELLFKKAINNYSYIFKYWEEVFENNKLLKKFIKINFPDEKMEFEELSFIKESIENDILVMITQIADATLSTPKMAKIYNSLYQDENPYNVFFSIILESESEKYTKSLIDKINQFTALNKNYNFYKILKTKLYYDIVTKSLPSEIQKNIKSILIDLEFKINGTAIKRRGISKKEITNMLNDRIRLSKLIN